MMLKQPSSQGSGLSMKQEGHTTVAGGLLGLHWYSMSIIRTSKKSHDRTVPTVTLQYSQTDYSMSRLLSRSQNQPHNTRVLARKWQFHLGQCL